MGPREHLQLTISTLIVTLFVTCSTSNDHEQMLNSQGIKGLGGKHPLRRCQVYPKIHKSARCPTLRWPTHLQRSKAPNVPGVPGVQGVPPKVPWKLENLFETCLTEHKNDISVVCNPHPVPCSETIYILHYFRTPRSCQYSPVGIDCSRKNWLLLGGNFCRFFGRNWLFREVWYASINTVSFAADWTNSQKKWAGFMRPHNKCERNPWRCDCPRFNLCTGELLVGCRCDS